tara:strand:+ start:6588 stop:6911 length:324 start_codon:yes stop_codon:yes gene_type:complete
MKYSIYEKHKKVAEINDYERTKKLLTEYAKTCKHELLVIKDNDVSIKDAAKFTVKLTDIRLKDIVVPDKEKEKWLKDIKDKEDEIMEVLITTECDGNKIDYLTTIYG